ncbi:hypothetical protein [Bradyrhizobium sp. WD16]|uniref:hypothetical protein n=1 Tax=Bradyrhizobium sp. WD16 TaxID=1521768 RepID=UPI0020A3B07E|nr:hypothetical protein [Bradyrhizobium sp. WD16]
MRRAHETFGAFGVETHLVICGSCGHVALRTFRPGKGYLRLPPAELLWEQSAAAIDLTPE